MPEKGNRKYALCLDQNQILKRTVSISQPRKYTLQQNAVPSTLSQMCHTLMILKSLKTLKHFGIVSFLQLPSLRSTYGHAGAYNVTRVLSSRKRLEVALKHDKFQAGYQLKILF